jgi:hypothetical protein
MENQSKRPNQIKFAEDVTFYTIFAFILTLILILLTNQII